MRVVVGMAVVVVVVEEELELEELGELEVLRGSLVPRCVTVKVPLGRLCSIRVVHRVSPCWALGLRGLRFLVMLLH